MKVSVRAPRTSPRFTTNPPLAPTGTITAFFTVCAFISPRTSVRKSSRRSDQRMPPRAMSPARRCTPSTAGDATQISWCGPRPGEEVERGRVELHREVRLAAVRVGAHRRATTTATSARRMRSASRLATASTTRAELGDRARPRPRRHAAAPGSRRWWNSATSSRTASGFAAQRVGQVRVGEPHAGLAQVLAERAHDDDVARPRARRAAPAG